MDQYNKIGFLGAGNMGEAFIGAIIRSRIFPPAMICISDISKTRLDMLHDTYGVTVMDTNTSLFSACDVVVIAVKPQQIDPLLSEIAKTKGAPALSRKLIISIAAGIRIRQIESVLYAALDEAAQKRLPIIRVMPNTPALVLEGMSGMTPNAHAGEQEMAITRKILEAMGRVIEFEEPDLDAVTALSGSGPAYVFFLIEAMVEAGVHVGLNPENARVLSLQTMKGALKLMAEGNETPEQLRRKVTSPGGTTEAAFQVLETRNVKQHIVDAIAAATRRSKELSR